MLCFSIQVADHSERDAFSKFNHRTKRWGTVPQIAPCDIEIAPLWGIHQPAAIHGPSFTAHAFHDFHELIE
jgi:hypothetical protein